MMTRWVGVLKKYTHMIPILLSTPRSYILNFPNNTMPPMTNGEDAIPHMVENMEEITITFYLT